MWRRLNYLNGAPVSAANVALLSGLYALYCVNSGYCANKLIDWLIDWLKLPDWIRIDGSNIINSAISRRLWVTQYVETWCCCLCSHFTQLWAGLREPWLSSNGHIKHRLWKRWCRSTCIFQLKNIADTQTHTDIHSSDFVSVQCHDYCTGQTIITIFY